MNLRHQGDLGEVSAMHWLAMKGVPIFIPVGHSPDCDLVAQIMGELVRVQVKTSKARCGGSDRWRVTLCTRGGNRSGAGAVKRLDASRCDYLFAHVGDGRRWFIPANCLAAGVAVVLGGPRYAQFEVEPGEPLVPEPGSKAAIESARLTSGGCPSG